MCVTINALNWPLLLEIKATSQIFPQEHGPLRYININISMHSCVTACIFSNRLLSIHASTLTLHLVAARNTSLTTLWTMFRVLTITMEMAGNWLSRISPFVSDEKEEIAGMIDFFFKKIYTSLMSDRCSQ